MNERPELPKEDVVPSLWKRYKATDEYRIQGRIMSINSSHALVREAEKHGLNKLVMQFIGILQHKPDIKDEYTGRSANDWITEWAEMHTLLFKYVYKSRGTLRVTGHDVRFGNPGDEDLHGIPLGGNPTRAELMNFANNLGTQLAHVNASDIDDVCGFLARTHYGLIRIHPYGDGNGRITRAVTDQLAISLGYPPVIARYPRLDEEAKKKYHAAINSCVGDINCMGLASWIKSKLQTSLDDIA